MPASCAETKRDRDPFDVELYDLLDQVAARMLPHAFLPGGIDGRTGSHDAMAWIARKCDADRVPIAPSHRLQDLQGLAGAATRLADMLEALDVEAKLLIGGGVRMDVERGAPHTLRLAFENAIACVALLRIVARRADEFAGRPPSRSRNPRSGRWSAAGVPDIEAHYRNIAERYLSDGALWRLIAATALEAGDYRSATITRLSPGALAQRLETCIIWARKVFRHLSKFTTAELEQLVWWPDVAWCEAEPPRAVDPALAPSGRWILLTFLLEDIRNAGMLPEAFPGYAAGRIPVHDPARFAIEGLAAIWLRHCATSFGGRAPKAGSFSRFAEEALTEGPGVLPASEVRSALRWFHDHKDSLTGVLWQKMNARLGAPPDDRRAVTT